VQDTDEFFRGALPLLRKNKSITGGIYSWSGTMPEKKMHKMYHTQIFPISNVFEEGYF
jgi:hypothetical protein